LIGSLLEDAHPASAVAQIARAASARAVLPRPAGHHAFTLSIGATGPRPMSRTRMTPQTDYIKLRTDESVRNRHVLASTLAVLRLFSAPNLSKPGFQAVKKPWPQDFHRGQG
jgi:hypothetical protein